MKHNWAMLHSSYWKTVCLAMVCLYAVSSGQEKVQINYKADRFENDVIDDEPCKKLIGNVVFSNEDITIEADRLFYYEQKALIKAYDHIKITAKEGSTILAELLTYNGDDKVVQLRNNITYQSAAFTFCTDHLDYNVDTKNVHFAHGGRLVEKDNILTSTLGYYNDTEKTATFYQEVVVTNPEYTLQCDRLIYNTVTQIAQCKGPTKVMLKKGILMTDKGGEYNMSNQDATFQEVTFLQDKVESGGFVLRADLLKLDKAKECCTATGNVKLYKTNLQGVADAVVYHATDSTFFLYNNPVIWGNGNQITADSIKVIMEQQEIHSIFMNQNALIASEDSLGNYNQLKGSDMQAYFKEKKIDYITIEGNGESIYFVMDDRSQLLGMNHIKCSRVRINMENDKLENIIFYEQPTGLFYPPHMLKEEYKKLDGFKWRIEEQPTKAAMTPPSYDETSQSRHVKFNQES